MFLLAVAPILIAWQGTRTRLWWWVGFVIFFQIANQIIVQAYWLPLGLRIPHTIELLVDWLIQASFYVWILEFPYSRILWAKHIKNMENTDEME